MYRLFRTDFFNFEALRLLSFTAHGAGEVAEFFEALGKVKENDVTSWYSAWKEAAEKAEQLAVDAEAAGHRDAARKAYFRAANYQRAAQFMLNGPAARDSRILSDSEAAVSNFWKGLCVLDASTRRIDIPYDDGLTLPGYIHLPHPSKRLPGKLPVLLNTVGGDATQEEIFYIFPQAALELGYAVVSFEGPGQGIVLRRDNLPFRPDWEYVVGKVLDFTIAHVHATADLAELLDVQRLAISGSSMGGYLSLRGAADPRIRACVAVDPFYCMWDMLKGRVPDFLLNAFVAGGFAPDGFWNGLLGMAMWASVQTDWEMSLMRWMLGAGDMADVLRKMRLYTFATGEGESHLARVRCPVFVTGARFSLYCLPEVSTERIYEELVNVPEGKKVKWVAQDAGQGGLQSKVGAFGILTQKTFAFLDDVFGIDRKL
ncbi:alpha/beta-hydrolase [Nemania sp. FL0916]|nr:alpha/beta-hydrolase [Nemania sp. FL0916]